MNAVRKGNAMRRFSIAIVVTLIAISNAGPIVQAAGQATAQPLAQPLELPWAQPTATGLPWRLNKTA